MEAHKLTAHSHALYDREASRKPTSLSVNSDLLEKARELGVDVATTLEEALASEVHKRQRETCWPRIGRRLTPTTSSSHEMAYLASACGAFDAPVYGLPEQQSPDSSAVPFLLDVQNHLLSDRSNAASA
ncbi:MAG: type II toxin-antitoxin system CcdA family antitoxin [Thermoanaerobaculia bacterium]